MVSGHGDIKDIERSGTDLETSSLVGSFRSAKQATGGEQSSVGLPMQAHGRV